MSETKASADQPPPRDPALERLDAFVGTWATEGEIRATPSHPAIGIRATDVYEWLPGGFFLVHRWDSRMPEGRTQGIEIIGYDPASGTYPMHSYDSHGNAGVMQATMEGNRWAFLGDSLRFRGGFSDDGNIFSGVWEHRESDSDPWVPWMDIRLRRTG